MSGLRKFYTHIVLMVVCGVLMTVILIDDQASKQSKIAAVVAFVALAVSVLVHWWDRRVPLP